MGHSWRIVAPVGVSTNRGEDQDGFGGRTADSTCSVHRSTTAPGACSLSAGEIASDDDKRFALTRGGVYEIVLFHAERHTVESNFQLTMAGFLAPHSYCQTYCGDESVGGTELCDEGLSGAAPSANTSGTPVNHDGEYGACDLTCTYTFCGDGARNGPEACDNGLNLDTYVAAPSASACAPGCAEPGYCGDGIFQSAYEVCDDGTNDGAYGGCMPGCQALGGYCGDGIYQPANEGCDETQGLTSHGGCGFDCQPSPYCGDGVRNGAEQCDGSPTCNADCMFTPICGDGLTNTAAGEQCDFGEFGFDGAPADAPYGGCTTQCEWGPYCGDGELQSGRETCDLGTQNAAYSADGSGCGYDCQPAPFCGDGVRNGQESCDDGVDANTGAYGGCNPDCTLAPYCGDRLVQGNEGEMCDDGPRGSLSCDVDCHTRDQIR